MDVLNGVPAGDEAPASRAHRRFWGVESTGFRKLSRSPFSVACRRTYLTSYEYPHSSSYLTAVTRAAPPSWLIFACLRRLTSTFIPSANKGAGPRTLISSFWAREMIFWSNDTWKYKKHRLFYITGDDGSVSIIFQTHRVVMILDSENCRKFRGASSFGAGVTKAGYERVITLSYCKRLSRMFLTW